VSRAGPSVPRPVASEPRPVATELRRVAERWKQLPLDDALRSADDVRGLVQRLADRVAVAAGEPPARVPDLGPAVLMDQLAVMVHDACVAGLAPGVAADLAGLRRTLSREAPTP